MRSSRSFSALWHALGKPEHHGTLFQNQKQKQKEENSTILKVDWMSLSEPRVVLCWENHTSHALITVRLG